MSAGLSKSLTERHPPDLTLRVMTMTTGEVIVKRVRA